MKRRSDDEKRRILSKIEELVLSGSTKRSAIKTCGIQYSQYHGWSKKFSSTSPTVEIIKPTQPSRRVVKKRNQNDESRAFMLFGTPSQLSEVMRGLR